MAHRETARHLAAFEAWYAADRNTLQTSAELGVPRTTLQDWMDWFGWRARADQRDREAAEIAEKLAIKRRAAMLERHRKAAELLTTRGMEFFEQKEIEKASDATAAIKAGVELERQAEGMPDWVLAVMNADETSLDRQIAELEYRLKAALPAVPETAGDALAAGSNGNGHHAGTTSG